MKAAFITLVLILLVCLAADLWLSDPAESRVFTPLARERIARYIPAARPVLFSKKDEIKDDRPSPAPAPSASRKTDVFIPPKFDSLETLTAGWTQIPATAFPRMVKLQAGVEFKLPSGTMRLPAGASALARSMQAGLVTVSPTAESDARATILCEQTDMRSQIEANYQTWVTQRTEVARKQWESKKDTVSVSRSSSSHMPLEKGCPVSSADGSYPLLLASMEAGDVTEITPKKVKRWGSPVQRDIAGVPTWCIDVVFGTMVFCGPVDATAQARVRDGRVIEWVYPGSGEPVP